MKKSGLQIEIEKFRREMWFSIALATAIIVAAIRF